ncbi:MAG: hypothetical protein IJZ03_03675 [Clostridia bacterium]|nr:hypothetical protein [Clostridia bacterium]MBQ9749602.1 hypothetical protein [Clostridia bacterium]
MKKKLLTAAILTVAAIALVVVTVLTTIAYLTSSSAVSNTFTVGNVGIKMYESNVDDNGKKIADTDLHGTMKDSDGNNYHLMPGKTYDKDPTIYVDASSDSSYLFVKVRNNISSIEYGNFVHADNTVSAQDSTKPTIEKQMIANGWVKYLETATGTVYLYTDGNGKALPVGGTNTDMEIDVFSTFSIDEHADISLYGGAKVTLTAFAIQTAGFVDNTETAADEAVDAAWAAIVETYPYEGGAAVNNP